jgi:thymidine kinase
MNEINIEPSIDLIIGPMFSGKSTELLRRLVIYKEIFSPENVLYINCDIDDRSNKDFSTHNPLIKNSELDFMSKKVDINCINELLQLENLHNIKVIGIDEAQMFKDIYSTIIKLVEEKDIKVIISGLNSDCYRNDFGDLYKFFSKCDTITKLNPFCKECKDSKVIKPAIFSKRVCNKNSDQIVIGGKDVYIPVCRKCYLK